MSNTSMPSNFLERLPAEIRLMVYSTLGFPTGTKMWLDCPGPPYCFIKSHVIFHEDSDWPMTWHACRGAVEIFRRVEQIDWRGPLRKARVKIFVGGPVPTEKELETCQALFGKYEQAFPGPIWTTIDVDDGLLGVNKSIRDELLRLVFENTEVRFLPRYSYAKGQQSRQHEEQAIFRFEPKIVEQPLICHFAYLTGIIFTETQHRTGDNCRFDILASMIPFIKTNCDNIESLTYTVGSVTCFAVCNEDWIKGFRKAWHDLVRSCTKLKILRISIEEEGSVRCLCEGGLEEVVTWMVRDRGAMIRASVWYYAKQSSL